MATLTATNPTLLDWTKRLAPNGAIDTIAELLTEPQDLLNYITWVEGNLPTGHRTTVRTGLPTPTWRKLYGYVAPTKSTTAQVQDSCGMLEAYAEVDKDLAELNGNTAQFRLSEDKAHIDGMGIEFMDSFIYATEATAPEEITGLHYRFNSTTAENSSQLLDGGASGGQTDTTSIWLVVFSPQTVFGIFPKGSTAGLRMTDKGQVTSESAGDNTASTGRMEVYRTHYQWKCGLCVRDWRYVSRAYKIDVSTLLKDAASGADLVNLMTRMQETIPNLNSGRPVYICNRKIKSFLRQQMVSMVKNSTLSMDTVAGRHVMTFDGIPVVRCDSIGNNEEYDGFTVS